MVGLTDDACSAVNVETNTSPPEQTLAAGRSVASAGLIINARVAANPELLSKLVNDAVSQACSVANLAFETRHIQSFRPGQPMVRLVSIS